MENIYEGEKLDKIKKHFKRNKKKYIAGAVIATAAAGSLVPKGMTEYHRRGIKKLIKDDSSNYGDATEKAEKLAKWAERDPYPNTIKKLNQEGKEEAKKVLNKLGKIDKDIKDKKIGVWEGLKKMNNVGQEAKEFDKIQAEKVKKYITK